MSLGTGEVINRAPSYWTEVVISDVVISRVEALAKHQDQPMIQDSNLVVEYSPDQPIEDDEYDGDYEPTDGQDSDDESLGDSVMSITHELSDDEDESTGGSSEHNISPSVDNSPSIGGQEAPGEPEEGHDFNEIVEDEAETPSDQQGATEDPEDSHHDVDDIDEMSHASAAVATEQEVDSEPEQGPSPTETSTNTGYHLRSDRNRSYSYRFANAVDNPPNSKSYYPDVQLLQHAGRQTSCDATPELKKQVCGFILTQMTAKAGSSGSETQPARPCVRSSNSWTTRAFLTLCVQRM